MHRRQPGFALAKTAGTAKNRTGDIDEFARMPDHDSMKSKRRLVIMLTYATAVFLCAKAQSNSTGITTQITLAALYLGPAVVLHFAINWIWGDETPPPDNTDGKA